MRPCSAKVSTLRHLLLATVVAGGMAAAPSAHAQTVYDCYVAVWANSAGNDPMNCPAPNTVGTIKQVVQLNCAKSGCHKPGEAWDYKFPKTGNCSIDGIVIGNGNPNITSDDESVCLGNFKNKLATIKTRLSANPPTIPMDTPFTVDHANAIKDVLDMWQNANYPTSGTGAGYETSNADIPDTVEQKYVRRSTWTGPATWTDTSGNPDIQYNYTYVKDVFALRCTSCHKSVGAGGTFPDWLDFSSSKALKMGSYYAPGKTKTEAAVIRNSDGTMPPGVDPDVITGHFTYQELQQIAEWIAGGYPENWGLNYFKPYKQLFILVPGL